MNPAPSRGRYNIESFKVFNGPGACLFLAKATATSAGTSFRDLVIFCHHPIFCHVQPPISGETQPIPTAPPQSGAGSHRAHSGVVSAPGRLHAVPAADLGAFPWAPDWQSGAGPSWSLAPAATCAVSKKIATGIEFLPVFLGGMIFLQGDWLFGHPWYLCWSVER